MGEVQHMSILSILLDNIMNSIHNKISQIIDVISKFLP